MIDCIDQIVGKDIANRFKNERMLPWSFDGGGKAGRPMASLIY